MLDVVVIATDDKRIAGKCVEYDMDYVMTSEAHNTPTSRLYEVSESVNADFYILIMGDEPLIDYHSIELIIPKEIHGQYYVMALTNELLQATEVIDYRNHKVVTNANRETMIISRSPIPYPKGFLDFKYEKVTGIQAFSNAVLDFYNKTLRSVLERAEENDLMRFVENGILVKMMLSKYKTVSVDTEKDLRIVEKRYLNGLRKGQGNSYVNLRFEASGLYT